MRVRAARLVAHGEPLEVEEVELAPAGEGEVVVDMAYSGVNPVDWYGAQGRVASDGPLPRTPGGEGAGTVDGKAVVVFGHGLGRAKDGLWADRAVVPRSALVEVPDGVDLRQAGAIGIAGVTAWRCVNEIAQLSESDSALVFGAGGGVGSMIVSLGRSTGATVWAQTGQPAKAEWLRELGADDVIVAGPSELLDSLSGRRPTVVFDCLGDGFTGAAIEAMDLRGRLVIYGTSAEPVGEVPLQQLYRKELRVLSYAGMIEADDALATGIRRALDAVADGALRVAIDSVVPLTQVNEAFDKLRSRTVRGKLVLDNNA